jgi:hypothetical protein
LKNPKNILFLTTGLSLLISLAISAIPVFWKVEIDFVGLNLQLAFVAVMFFIYSLFLQSKLGENSFYHRWELIKDRFLIICFIFYFFSLMLNVTLSLFKSDVQNISFYYQSSYILINMFSLCLAFCLFIFIVQLINPVKHAYYLISKINRKDILEYNLFTISSSEERELVITRNLYSPIVNKEDPLMAIHELLVPSIKNFDFRSIGLVIKELINYPNVVGKFSHEEDYLKFTAHILSYTTRLQQNLKKNHDWNDIGFVVYFTYLQLDCIKKMMVNDKQSPTIHILSLLRVLHYYYKECNSEMKQINFQEHIKLIESIPFYESKHPLKALKKIFKNEIKNPVRYLDMNMKIKGVRHSW